MICFPKPLDYALLQHEIEVPGVTGKVAVARDETEWRFTPDSPWRAGDFKIVVRTTLEDLAGNHINRAFDVDTFDPITRTVRSRDRDAGFTDSLAGSGEPFWPPINTDQRR